MSGLRKLWGLGPGHWEDGCASGHCDERSEKAHLSFDGKDKAATPYSRPTHVAITTLR